MKINKHYLWLLSLVVIALIWYSDTKHIDIAALEAGKVKAKVGDEPSKLASSKNQEIIKKSQSIEKKNEDINLRITSVLTPSMRTQIFEARMRMREPKYRDLFQSWNLPLNAQDELVKLLHERDLRLQEAYFRRLEAGKKGGQDFLSDNEVEKQLCEHLIREMIGDEKLRSLQKLESQLNQIGQSKLNSFIKD